MTDPAATVIIVNYNSGARLARCLDRLARQTRRDFAIIVIDNQSSDGSHAAAREAALPVTLIEAGANLGFAAGNNRAAEKARGEWLVFLNPDAYAAPDWFEKLMEGAARYPFADAFGSTQIDALDPAKLDGAGDVFHVFGIAYRGGFGWPVEMTPPDGECFAPCAAAAMYRRARFAELGGFDESFFCYGEDVDLGFRLRLAGGRAVQLAGAKVFHEGSAISGRHSAFTVYHGNRNRIWATYKSMPAEIYWPLAPGRFAVDFYLLVRHALLGNGIPYLKALRDGYSGLRSLKQERRRIQGARRINTRALAKSLIWLPFKILRRAPSLQSITMVTPP